MDDLTLDHPIYTLDGQVLLSAGTVLSRDTVDALVSSHRHTSYEQRALLGYGSVREDLQGFLKEEPYQRIFAGREVIAGLLNLMETVQLAPPLLQSLDYFREHDFHTYHHILMVFALSSLLAEELIPDEEDRRRLVETGPTHDLGKICVPIPILQKATPLTRSEKNIIEHHAVAGYVLLSYYLKDTENFAAGVARDHHERRNGTGYPQGILLKDPMIEIIAVSDVYDALISPRSYRPLSYDNRTALEEITAMAERKEVSWNVVKALVAYNRKDKPHYTEEIVSREKRGTPPPGNVHGMIAEDENEAEKE